jgi:FkbM family methyltransferase
MNSGSELQKMSKMDVHFEYAGHDLTLRTLGDCSVSSHIKAQKSFYELPYLEAIKGLVSEGACVLDVGAHIGNHTLYFAKILKLRVLAFEPNPAAFAALQFNISANQLADQVDAFNVAISDFEGTGNLAPLYKNDSGSMGLVAKENDVLQVDVRQLDSYMKCLPQEQGLGLIKLDVEGSELAALRGGKEIIGQFLPYVSTEVQNELQYKEIKTFLKRFSLTPKSVVNPTPTIIWANDDKHSEEQRLALTEMAVVYGIQQAISHNRTALNAAELFARLTRLESRHVQLADFLQGDIDTLEYKDREKSRDAAGQMFTQEMLGNALRAFETRVANSTQDIGRLIEKAKQAQLEEQFRSNSKLSDLNRTFEDALGQLKLEKSRLEDLVEALKVELREVNATSVHARNVAANNRARARMLVESLRRERRMVADLFKSKAPTPVVVSTSSTHHDVLETILAGCSNYLHLDLKYQEFDLTVKSRSVAHGLEIDHGTERFGVGTQNLTLAYILHLLENLQSEAWLIYFHSGDTLNLVQQLFASSGLQYSLLFAEIPDVPWTSWHYLNSAQHRVVANLDQVDVWEKKYLFDVQTLAAFVAELREPRPRRTLGTQPKTSSAFRRILLVSYYMPPFKTVAMQRLDYWAREMEKIASDDGIDLRLEIVTASGGGTADNIIQVPDYGQRNCEDDTEMLATLHRLQKVKLNYIGLTWSSYVKRYFSQQLDLENRYDAVLISGNPFYYFDLGEFFSRLGSKVILDFRDPFAHNPRFTYTPDQKAVVQELEDRYLTHADLVTAVNQHCIELIGTSVKPPTLVVSNGYDESFFVEPYFRASSESSPIRFIYAGTFYHDCSPEKFVGALQIGLHKFVHAGRAQASLNGLEDTGVLDEKGLLSYQEVMLEVAEANAGMIFTGGKPFEHTTKIFDYIAADIDIVIVTEGEPQTGELHTLTAGLDRVFWIKNSRTDISNFLASYIPEKPNRRNKDTFSRRYQTQKLVEAISGLCGENYQ